MNNAPSASGDSVKLCFSPTSRTVKVNVLANGIDIDNDKIFLTNAYFVNTTDTALATLTVNSADSTISLTLKPNVNIGETYVFDIIYDIKDNGLPASQCATGNLKIKVFLSPTLSSGSTLTPALTCSDSIFNYTAKSVVTSIPTTFSWSRATVSDIAEAGTSGTDGNISERLTNTSPNPATVTYIMKSTAGTCNSTDTVKVIVYAKLKGGTIGSSQAYCSDTMPNIPLGITPPTGGKGNYAYQWQSCTDSNTWNNIGITTEKDTITGTLTQTTWYRRAVTDSCGTVYSDTVKIYINPLPVVSAESTEICVGTSTLLSPITGGTWKSSNTGVVAISNNNTATGVSSGTATLTFTSSTTGCSQSLPISVKTFPIVDEITGPHTVCINKSIQLTNQTNGGTWTSNNAGVTISDPNANPVTITGVKEGMVFVSYTVNNGVCQTRKTYFVKVIPSGYPLIYIGFPK
jgi:hypothetical protein